MNLKTEMICESVNLEYFIEYGYVLGSILLSECF